MRADWETLPPAVRASVESHTGPVLKAEPVSTGTANQFTAVLHPADGPAVFCKGVHGGTGPHLRMLRAEAAIGPHLAGLAPAVRWQATTTDWAILGFEHVPGCGADLAPGSPDLPLIADLLDRMRRRLTPCPPAPTLPLAERWARFPAWQQLASDGLDPWAAAHLDQLAAWEQRAPEAVDGGTLAHCDLAWNNILIGPRGVRVVDWALAGRAAPWVDTAFMVLRLIQYGHTPREAEAWAQQVTDWHSSDDAVTAFAAAVAGIRVHRAQAPEAPAHMPQLAAAALSWVRYRLE
ncbi:phosphotransferase family protein [Peterkaempfera sp. SMS 1(5)a]|uniref:phosphotransferase family protein n=1 Tax=Peterkaempfera podocarpi TaxID=3232308 RepID=UPI00366AB663